MSVDAAIQHVKAEIETIKKQLESDMFCYYKNNDSAKSVKMLNIDDDADDCELLKQACITFTGVDYTAINCPVYAVDCLKKGFITPDLIILDINMPLMNGFEVLTSLNKNDNLRKIPVIFFTTSCTPDMENEALRLGAVKCITKPTDYSNMNTILREFLSFI